MHEEVTTRFEYDPMLEETITRPMVNPMDWQLRCEPGLAVCAECTHLTSQNPINRGQVYCLVNGKKLMRAVPKTQSKLPTVIMSSRVFAHRVATTPAIKSEMTWSERPAQSSRAALKVE